ncbi:MAG: radical SAM family heme chaperone HemW [Arcanobacterium sp.]|nr:radical SAM family heme chaperone HemW [Arcanobacterium sp.]
MVDLPQGVSAPPDGALPHPDVSSGFAAYVHIPFCAVRCGYCDFNTYTNVSFGQGATPDTYAESVMREIDLSRKVLCLNSGSDDAVGMRSKLGFADATSDGGVQGSGASLGASADDGNTHDAARPKLTSVYFGGGTPTLLDAHDLRTILEHLRNTFGIMPGAEVTTEANPETITPEYLEILKSAGFNRISFGMQSAVPRVLQTLDRKHTPGQVRRVTEWARDIGFEYSVDIIYGAPGESLSDWERSVREVISLEPDHISAYGLTIEPGTKMGSQLARGQIAAQDDAVLAQKYERADELLNRAGYQWYEISNWAKPGHESRHNLTYWKGGNWWGYGPGAHSHINGVRFWNVKHPLAYANRLAAGAENNSPAAGREILSDAERREEYIMLGIRLAEGIAQPRGIDPQVITQLIARGLLQEQPARSRGQLVLTRQGRLLADMVIRELW